ncbi:MAG: WYL domain-containing protein [Coriobacteriia bacterium]|nr:WYL domain-containing protein [Coriobacteriia bacterium]
MSEAVNRVINLALCLADASTPLSAERIRSDVEGYGPGQDQAAFLRMFERDKELLRAAGFVINGDEDGTYTLDRAASFATPIELSHEEAAAVQAAATAMLSDPSYPYADELRLALAKITTGVDTDSVASAARLADENPAQQGVVVAALWSAAERGKPASFTYTNSYGATAPHHVEPYGVFLHDGRWYLVGRDTNLDDVRTYTCSRMDDVVVETARPATPDFERPADFDVRVFVRLPFQYGPPADEFVAELRFDGSAAWRAESLSAGQGELTPRSDGGVDWRVSARSGPRLARFVVESGPGLAIVGPESLSGSMVEGLEEVLRIHG